MTGDAGHTFWKKLGFHAAERFPHPHLREYDEFANKIEEQAKAADIDPEKAKDSIIMGFDLK